MKRADCTFVYIIPFSKYFVNTSISTEFQFNRHDSNQFFGFNVHRSTCFLRGEVVKRRQSTPDQHPGSSEFSTTIGSTGKRSHHNLMRRLCGAADCDN